MNERLIGILVESGITMIAGLFLAYLGFLSPIFRRSSERLAPDRLVGVFRVIARIAGPLLCVVAGVQTYRNIRQEPVMDWHDFTSPEGRFRISSPVELVEDVREVPYGEWRVSECNYRASVPTLGFLAGYIDLPAGLQKIEPDKILNTELEGRVHAAGVELLDKKPTRFAGCPAVRFKLHYLRGGYYVDGILLVAKQRRYQLAVDYTSEDSSQVCKQFFDSFRILDGP